VTEPLDTEMRRSSLAASLMFHAAALILAVVSLPFLKHKYETPPPIAIDLVTVAQISQTTKPAPQEAKKPPEKKVEEQKPPEIKKPPPAPTNKATEVQKPVEKPPEKEVKVEKPVEKPIDENAPPAKKPPPKKVVKKPPPKKEEPQRDFSSVLKNLVDVKPQPKETKVADADKQATPDTGQALPVGPQMTMNENDAFIRQLEGCWDVPYGAKDAGSISVDVFMVINQDRTLQSAKIVDTARYNSDSFFRAMADSTMRAVHSPSCSPFDLPPDKYESWKTITVTFDPSQMF
jgi:outer membrane biosynthesis protein TonB